ncbi:hypothetical protein PSP20601_04670 [Pandoraea sputorum]|uniref:Uncharacterized protein n=1 Tax=Pandoraea sputorum TaxID=93222 RepID=A0A239SS31_9BURK|nr:Uncharacterised protein [Pandoraea sputorum]VVE50875.1 hypothetical protein PSP20601_04670 [Pandoraea sputorum]
MQFIRKVVLQSRISNTEETPRFRFENRLNHTFLVSRIGE